MIRRTPIRKVSKKRANQNAEYSKKRKAFLEAHPYCQWWLNENFHNECGIHNGMVRIDGGGLFLGFRWVSVPKSNQIHHKKGRTGEMLLKEEYWLAVSEEGHLAIHADPKKSYEKGYMLHRNGR